MEPNVQHGPTRDDFKLSPGKKIFKTQFTCVFHRVGVGEGNGGGSGGGLCLLCRILSHEVKRREFGSPCVLSGGHYHVL